MNTGPKVAIAGVVVAALAVGGELLYLHHRNVEDRKPAAKVSYYSSDPDDNVFMKGDHPLSLKDEKALKGRSLWVSAGGQMDYYPYSGGKVDYAHTQGTLLGAERVVVQDAIEAVAPKTAAFRIPQGDRHVLLVFTKPDDPAKAGKTFAVPVGFKQAGDYTFSTDQIFFYEDPHQAYSYWGPAIWKAIDEHRATLGMTEREVQMALGQISNPHGDRAGDRMVEFEAQGHPKRVTFENGKAVKIEDEKQFGG